MRRYPRIARLHSPGIFLTVAAIFLIAAVCPSVARPARSEKKTEEKQPKKETKSKPLAEKAEESKKVRTSALRGNQHATVRYVNRRGQTEVEITPAINRQNITGREQVINRRDDNTPTITTPPPVVSAEAPEVIIDISRQQLSLVKGGRELKKYSISTSRFGIGDRYHSYKTPVGHFTVDGKIGGNLPLGAVLKQGRFTGEVLQPNAPGRDPIVTRVIRLRGMEARNANAFGRGIFIHGTPDEKRIGKPVSWGCVRMRSTDVIDLYARIGDGTKVRILHPDESSPIPRKGWFANLFNANSNAAAGSAEKGTEDSGT